MNIPEIEKKITDHKLKKTTKLYDFNSFNDLCRALDITPVKSAGQRKALEIQLKRFFDYEKVPGTNKIKITGTHYGKPLPYVTKKTGVHWTPLNRAIGSLIMIYTELIGKEYSKYMILETIGIRRDEPKSKFEGWDDRHTYVEYIKKTYDGLKSAMTQLDKAGYISFTNRYTAHTAKGEITLKPEQIASYNASCEKLLKKMHLDNLWTATYTNQGVDFRIALDKELMKQYGFNKVVQKYKIEKGPNYDLRKFKSSYPTIEHIPYKMLDAYITNDAADNFWAVITARIATKYVKAVGIMDAKHYEADMKEIMKYRPKKSSLLLRNNI